MLYIILIIINSILITKILKRRRVINQCRYVTWQWKDERAVRVPYQILIHVHTHADECGILTLTRQLPQHEIDLKGASRLHSCQFRFGNVMSRSRQQFGAILHTLEICRTSRIYIFGAWYLLLLYVNISCCAHYPSIACSQFDFGASKYEKCRDAPGAEIKLVCPSAVLFVKRTIYLMVRQITPSPNRSLSAARSLRSFVAIN